MSRLQPDLQHLTDELPAARRRGVEAAIASSPYLLNRVRASVEAWHLKKFRVSPSSEHSGGYYDGKDKAVYINEDTFAASSVRGVRLDTLTFVVGHEVGHSFLANGRRLSQQELLNNINGSLWTESDQTFGDVTAPAEKFLRFACWDESIAEVEGWNALASRVSKERRPHSAHGYKPPASVRRNWSEPDTITKGLTAWVATKSVRRSNRSLGLARLNDLLSEDLDAIVDVTLPITGLLPKSWPEAPETDGMVMHTSLRQGALRRER